MAACLIVFLIGFLLTLGWIVVEIARAPEVKPDDDPDYEPYYKPR